MGRRWILLVSLGIYVASMQYLAKADLPAIFIFGDSIADVGTNNFLKSLARANYPYHGIDFPNSKPTGRFSNGYHTIDFIAKQFGYNSSPPPFLSLLQHNLSFKSNILRGVNFASAGAGILDPTGIQLYVSFSHSFLVFFKVGMIVGRKYISQNEYAHIRVPLYVRICQKIMFLQFLWPFLLKEFIKKVQEAGIEEKLVTHPWDVVSLRDQIKQFETVCGNITEVLGASKGNSLLSNSLYLITIGSNDIFDYQHSLRSRAIPPQTFLATLHDTCQPFEVTQSIYYQHNDLEFESQTILIYTMVEDLYNLGARKFGIISVPPIGCCPFQRFLKRSEDGGCFEELNNLAQAFYDAIRDVLTNFSTEFVEVKYSFGNAYAMTTSIIHNPLTFGFKEIKTACCGNGTFNGEEECNPNSKLCPNRDDYLFWDWFHPTEAASELAALTLYGGGNEFVTPMNLSQLATIPIGI
ncbi:GDSL esterase/lipase At5g33370-like [Cornus florida]|uniref:GDSL esterase/lipase At5g33370-like n=1 Tax=Cornus florida TaxID=4283 RepID=UPI00289A1DFF|nr:GDSL esterase/lipase At5g33370-like [Cornus florida]